MSNYYETLGVSPQATADDIKKAYRKLAMQYHPDRNPGDPQAEARFKDINDAYSILSDADKRQQYDSPQSTGFPPGFHPFGAGGGLDDIIRDIFGRSGAGGGFQWNVHTTPPKNRDMQYTLNITLEDAFQGKQMPVHIQFGSVNRQINVSIPAGVESGYRMRFPAHGETTIPNAPPGDIYIIVQVQNHGRFVRHGHNLSTSINIDAIRACLGTECGILGIDNAQMQIKIPAGIQPGTQITVSNHGMPITSTTRRGDLVITVNVSVPTNISAEQRILLEKFISPNQGS